MQIDLDREQGLVRDGCVTDYQQRLKYTKRDRQKRPRYTQRDLDREQSLVRDGWVTDCQQRLKYTKRDLTM